MKKVYIVTMLMLFFTLLSQAAADTFRVRSMSIITLNPENIEGQTLEIGFNDAIGINFAGNSSFYKGVELEIKIPKDILSFQNSMAYGVYKNPTPAPDSAKIDYKGDQIVLLPLPSRLSFVMQIPLRTKHNLKTGPYSTVIPYVHTIQSGALLFRLLPVMKGLPDNIETLIFTVKIKPIISDEGALKLQILHPTETEYPVIVRIDEKVVDTIQNAIILGMGNHHISVTSEHYRNEMRVFTIDPARVTDISITMKDTIPRIFFIAPQNAQVFLDSQPILNPREPLIVEPGEHTVLFKIGDYELSKQIVIEKGKDYTASMIIDMNFAENQ